MINSFFNDNSLIVTYNPYCVKHNVLAFPHMLNHTINLILVQTQHKFCNFKKMNPSDSSWNCNNHNFDLCDLLTIYLYRKFSHKKKPYNLIRINAPISKHYIIPRWIKIKSILYPQFLSISFGFNISRIPVVPYQSIDSFA